MSIIFKASITQSFAILSVTSRKTLNKAEFGGQTEAQVKKQASMNRASPDGTSKRTPSCTVSSQPQTVTAAVTVTATAQQSHHKSPSSQYLDRHVLRHITVTAQYSHSTVTAQSHHSHSTWIATSYLSSSRVHSSRLGAPSQTRPISRFKPSVSAFTKKK